MLIDLTTVPYSDIKPHSIIVIRGENSQIDTAITTMRAHLDPSIAFQRMGEHTEVLVISEENMNEAGWFKAKETLLVEPSKNT